MEWVTTVSTFCDRCHHPVTNRNLGENGGGPSCKGPHSGFVLCRNCMIRMQEVLKDYWDSDFGFECFWDELMEEDSGGKRDLGECHIVFARFMCGLTVPARSRSSVGPRA